MKHDPGAPAPQRDWQSVIDANRRLDEAVAAVESAVWQTLPTAPAETRPAPAPIRVVAAAPAPAPATVPKPAPGGFPVWTIPARPMPSSSPPAVTPLPRPAEPITEDLEAVAQALEAEGAELRRQRAALLAGAVFVLPWSPTPRPVLAADGAPYQVTEEELRDVIQPHWRALAAQAAAAAAQLATAREAAGAGAAWRRMWRSRAALTAAEQADTAARQAVEAAGLIWESASLSERRAQMRTLAGQTREAAAAAAVAGAPELGRAIAATDEALALTTALRDRGVRAVERRPDETRAQALARAGAP